MNKEIIKAKAEEMLRLTRQPQKNKSVNVVFIAKQYGFSVGNAVLNNDDDGFIIIDEGKSELMSIKTDMLIGVNADRSLEWKRFIIAHELGHFILDFKENKLKGLYAHRDHKRGHSDSENDIDFFAANLLMPETEFSKKYDKLKTKNKNSLEIVNELASHFVITIPMAERRIQELSLQYIE